VLNNVLPNAVLKKGMDDVTLFLCKARVFKSAQQENIAKINSNFYFLGKSDTSNIMDSIFSWTSHSS